MRNVDAIFYAIGYGIGTVIALAVLIFVLWVLWYIVVGVYREIIHLCFGRIYHVRVSKGIVAADETKFANYEPTQIVECQCQACAEHRRLSRAKRGK